MLFEFRKGRLARVLGLDALHLAYALFWLGAAVLVISIFSKQIFGALIAAAQAVGL